MRQRTSSGEQQERSERLGLHQLLVRHRKIAVVGCWKEQRKRSEKEIPVVGCYHRCAGESKERQPEGREFAERPVRRELRRIVAGLAGLVGVEDGQLGQPLICCPKNLMRAFQSQKSPSSFVWELVDC